MTRYCGNGGPGKAKPTYNGDVAFRMKFPCIPPYQMKVHRKLQWIRDWESAQKEQRHARLKAFWEKRGFRF